jgi:hypothetical protein
LHTRTNSACGEVEICPALEGDSVLQIAGSEGVKVDELFLVSGSSIAVFESDDHVTPSYIHVLGLRVE